MTRRGFGLETGFDLKFAFIAKQILNFFEGCIDEYGARCWHFLILLLAGSDFFYRVPMWVRGSLRCWSAMLSDVDYYSVVREGTSRIDLAPHIE
jgi:hypothetical protein